MKIDNRQDISAPIEFVFGQITDFESFERRGLRRGAEISRKDPPGGVPGLGTVWKVRAKIRGKPRNFRSEITEYDVPNAMRIQSRSGGLETDFRVELMALSQQRTRMYISFEMEASSLTGRLVMQSLRLAKSAINSRFSKRLGEFAEKVEGRYADSRLRR